MKRKGKSKAEKEKKNADYFNFHFLLLLSLKAKRFSDRGKVDIKNHKSFYFPATLRKNFLKVFSKKKKKNYNTNLKKGQV